MSFDEVRRMGVVYADVRLGNDARPDLEEVNASALVDTGALHLCIPEHVALQLQLSQKQPREVQTADGKSHLV
ncbi:MAG: retroviral-like aspartic protease family protein, partial [Acidimicrobiia bacterium]